MVSKLLLVVTSIFLSSSIATNTNSFSPEASIKKVASVGTLKDENWVPYYYDDFERFSLDATQDDMFNRGMGKFYTLPDYISTSSDRVTYVDNFTKNLGTGDVGTITYKKSGDEARKIVGKTYDQQYRIPAGNKNVSNHGNPNT